MDNFLNDCTEGLNNHQKDSLLVFMEQIPKDLLSEFMSRAMASGTNTGNILGELAGETKYQERMSKLMEESLNVGNLKETASTSKKKK